MKAPIVCAVFLCVLVSSTAYAQEVYSPGNGVTAPVPVKTVQPPKLSVRATVVVGFVVQTDGSVTDLKVMRSGDSTTDAAAVDAVRQWEFRPGTKDGQPVAVRYYVQFTFTQR